MSILFLPPQSAGSVTIADATETTSGKIRIATSAEATAGTNDVTAMTPAKVKSVIDASLVGGVTYKGTLDASAPADLSNATKGDLYIISVAGTYAGKTWAVGDHLLINADMGGTLDSAKIDKVDNTDAVTSVAGRTGAVTLSTADISGLATVASTGAYSDLSGTPTLATVATTGAYSDLSGTPTLATVATTGAYSDLSGTPTLGTAAALDVGTSANSVVQLDGTGKLPAIDGSQLTNLPAGASALDDLTDVTITAAATGEVLRYNGSAWVDAQLAYSDLSGTPTLATVATTGAYSDLSGAPTNVSSFTNDAGYISDITAENLGDLADVDLTGLADGEILIYNSTSGNWESNPPPAPQATTTSVGLIEIAENAEATAGTATDKALVPSNISSITTAQLDNSAGTMLESANNLSDLADAATARTNLGLATVASTGAYSDLSGAPTNVSAFTNDAGYLTSISGVSLGDLDDVDLTGVANANVITYNSTSTNWEVSAVPAPKGTVSTYTTTTALSTPTAYNTQYIRANSSSAITITLPAASSDLVGFRYEIKRIGSGTLTVAANGSDTIEGGASITISVQGDARTIVAVSATSWEIF